MTNKQAQITINAIKFMLDHAQYSDDVEEALNVAVNVLTAQPSSSCAHENDQDLQQTCNKLATDCISRQAAMDFVGSMEMCDEISAEAYQKLMNYLEELPSAQPERTCVNCGRTANNGGWYADGRTRCPIEEHYALPKDGFCHLWEKRNVTDDDYPERREE